MLQMYIQYSELNDILQLILFLYYYVNISILI